MAYKQIITLYEEEEPWFNLSNSVGRPGANRKDDVMLVQALFGFVAKRRGGDTSLLGIARNELPNVTGSLDGSTIWAIQRFQLRWVKFMQMIDSAMRPATYEGNVQIMGQRVAPITLLVSHARDVDPLHFTSTLLIDFPELRQFPALDLILTLK